MKAKIATGKMLNFFKPLPILEKMIYNRGYYVKRSTTHA
jgi:hypothetical protein